MCYGNTKLYPSLRTAYLYIREHLKKLVKEVRTDLKALYIKGYDVVSLTKLVYPEIRVVREDEEEWSFTAADFQNVELPLFHRIIFILRRETNKPQSKTLALEAIQRHLKATILLAHLYDF